MKYTVIVIVILILISINLKAQNTVAVYASEDSTMIMGIQDTIYARAITDTLHTHRYDYIYKKQYTEYNGEKYWKYGFFKPHGDKRVEDCCENFLDKYSIIIDMVEFDSTWVKTNLR